MVADLGAVRLTLEETRSALDHHLLDEVADLGPPTMENLSRWIWNKIKPKFPDLFRVTVHRDSLEETASYFGPGEPERG
jgi:6-pyruvoyltetrahydropterin/6-carboxytetrahydropterin synthase